MTDPCARRLLAVIGLFAALATGTAEAATKRIMVYGDSNTWGWAPVERGVPSTRYCEEERWPGVLQAALGDAFEVVEEGLSARTTDLPDPTLPQVGGAGLDGSAYLPAALATHLPLDLVVIMLGTNDLKAMYDRSPFRIALGVGKLVDIVRESAGGVGKDLPGATGARPLPAAARPAGAGLVRRGFRRRDGEVAGPAALLRGDRRSGRRGVPRCRQS